MAQRRTHLHWREAEKGSSWSDTYCKRRFKSDDVQLVWDPERTTCRACLANLHDAQGSVLVDEPPEPPVVFVVRRRGHLGLIIGGKDGG